MSDTPRTTADSLFAKLESAGLTPEEVVLLGVATGAITEEPETSGFAVKAPGPKAMGNFEIQDLMVRFNQAESLASSFNQAESTASIRK